MNLPGAAVRRDDSTGENEGLGARAALEKQENIAAGHRVGAEALVTGNALQFENAFVEVGGAVDVVDVESGFENSREDGHGEQM